MKNLRLAFTLAEVLITLGIIGVVAAMTMPVLIGHYKEKVLETQYKKGINIISTAIQAIMAEEGTPGDLSNTPLDTCYKNNDAACFANIVSKYFKTSYHSDNQSFKDNFEAIEYTAYLNNYTAGGLFVPKAEARVPEPPEPGPLWDFDTCAGWDAKGGISCPEGERVDTSKDDIHIAQHEAPTYCCIPDEPEEDGYYWKRTTFGFQTADNIAFGFMEIDNESSLYRMLMDVNGLKAPNKINQDLFILDINKKGVIINSNN